MEIDLEKFAELVENVREAEHHIENLSCKLEDMNENFEVMRNTVEFIQDMLNELLTTRGPEHASS